MRTLLFGLFMLANVHSAFAVESQGYVFRYTGDTSEGAVIITQGEQAVFYECATIEIAPVSSAVLLSTLCNTRNAARGFNGAVVGDYFVPEQKFAFTRVSATPIRYQHGEVSENLIASGISTESKTAYFDPAHSDWMFENGINSFVSINDKEEPRIIGSSGSTFLLIKKITIDFPVIPAHAVVPSIK